MNAPDQTAQKIFAKALALADSAARCAYLHRACDGDTALLAEVESLLRAHAQAGDFLGQTVRLAAPDFVIERTGKMIGRYKLLERIGEGGFGTVFMAEQVEPVQRKVAIKIIKAGMDTREVVARFEAERQALALMDHANIARVLDAGATDAGRPYFVMELVRGIPITDYCDRKNLSTAERLHLFIKVCHAVQHAHQKGIIHRDLKPNNVLVTLHDGEPVPKVIDFGVAKALGQKLTEKTLFTGFQHMIGTPAYMSPEQAELSGLDIDTRADIYSLGVLLYELLTGATPFDRETMAKAALDEIRRMIRETEPPKPSTRLQTLGAKLTEVAMHRHTEPAALSRLLRGDLDRIVMKALEKDRRRRYETPDAFASDVARHLSNEPVLASPPSVTYLVAKFVRRHKAGLATASALVLLLAAGVVVSTWQAVRATRAERTQTSLRQQAEQAGVNESKQRQRAEQLAEQNRRNLYASRINLAQQIFEQGDIVRVKELLDSVRPANGQSDLRGFEWYYLWRLCHSEQQNLVGHKAPVRGLAFSPEGSVLASAGNEHVIRLWDPATGDKRRALDGHGGWISAVAFAPDGKILASGGKDKTVLLWDASSGSLRHSFAGFDEAVTAVAFAPRGDLLAAASGQIASGRGNPMTRYLLSGKGGEVKIWNPATHEQVAAFLAHQDGVLSMVFAPDGRTLVTGSSDHSVKIWDALTGKQLGTLTGLDGPVFSLAYAPDGETLAAAVWFPYNTDAEIKFWNAKSWTALPGLKARVPAVTCIAFTPDGKVLAAGGIDRIVRLWDLASGFEGANFKGHTEGVWALAFAPDGKTLASGSWDGTVKLWNVRRKPEWDVFEQSGGYSVSFSPDGKLLACGGISAVVVWDIGLGQRFFELPLEGQVSDVSVAFFPDGRSLAAAGTDGTLSIFDTSSRQVRCALRGHKDKIWSLAVSPDSQTVATGSGDSTIKLWDMARGQERCTLVGHSKLVRSLAFSADGRVLVSGSQLELKFWDVATANALQSINEPAPLVAISPDGKLLASAQEGWGTPGLNKSFSGIRIRDFSSRQELGTFQGHKDIVYQIAFSSDSKTLVTVSWDGTAKLWQVPGGQLLLTIPSGLSITWSAAFSSDGQSLAIGTGSGETGGRVVLLRAATEHQSSNREPNP